MSIILKPFAWLLTWMYNLVGNYGVALFLFAVLVKIILFPFSLKGKKNMIQSSMISEEVKKLQKMYGKNREKYTEEVNKLYERENMKPMSGCLWSFLPIFVLIPLYNVIRRPLKYMMGLGKDEIVKVANALNWDTVSVSNGWVKQAAIEKALAASQEAGGIISGYENMAYNELYLTSLINESNLEAVKAAVGEGFNLFTINFNFLGIDLSQVPTWKFWSNGGDWTTIGLFLIVIVSALTGVLSSLIMQRTNKISDQAQGSGGAMLWMAPIMSLWIGFMMPGLLNIYWIANNFLSVFQEMLCGKMLKKDYAKAAEKRKEMEARAREEEKQRKIEAREKKAKELEEAKARKKAEKERMDAEEKQAGVMNAEDSRIGFRAHARGRNYKPNRFGGVTPYFDPACYHNCRSRAARAEA